jgi:hypothetical protein
VMTSHHNNKHSHRPLISSVMTRCRSDVTPSKGG